MMSLNTHSKSPVVLSNRSFWIRWLLAFLGFPLAGLAAQAVVGGIDTPLQGLIGGVASGAVLGTVQWLALRGSLPISPRWILASAAGLGLGLALGVGVLGTETAGAALPLRGAVTGLLLGAAQAVVLRTVAPSLALRWLIAVPLGAGLDGDAGGGGRPLAGLLHLRRKRRSVFSGADGPGAALALQNNHVSLRPCPLRMPRSHTVSREP